MFHVGTKMNMCVAGYEGLQNKQLVFEDTVTFVHLSICVHAQTIMTGRSEKK